MRKAKEKFQLRRVCQRQLDGTFKMTVFSRVEKTIVGNSPRFVQDDRDFRQCITSFVRHDSHFWWQTTTWSCPACYRNWCNETLRDQFDPFSCNKPWGQCSMYLPLCLRKQWGWWVRRRNLVQTKTWNKAASSSTRPIQPVFSQKQIPEPATTNNNETEKQSSHVPQDRHATHASKYAN